MELLIASALIFLARMTNVAMGTVRILMGMRGKKYLSAAIGFVESLIFILAISQVLQNVNDIWSVIGYAAGFSAGTLVGLIIEERLALGHAVVRAISSSNGTALAARLRDAGYGVTELTGDGLNGKVQVITTVAKRKNIAKILSLMKDVDAGCFVAVEEARSVQHGYM